MELRRLNKNQINFRYQKVLSAMGDLVADQAFDMLTRAGVMQRMTEAGLLGDGVPVERPKLSEEEMAEQALRRALEANDMQAVELVEKRKLQRESVQAFDVRVEVVPYRIADTSLEQIVLEADAPVVIRIIEAVLERSRADRCPEEVVGALRNAMWKWNEWAVGGLATVKKVEDEPVVADTSE